MKLKRIIFTLILVALLLVMLQGVSLADTDTVVYVSGTTGDNNNSGLLISDPKETLGGAINLLDTLGTGGTIVVCDDISVGPWVATLLNDKITITSYYNGVNYGAKMNFGATNKKAVLVFQSEVEFNNITLNHVYSKCSEIWSSTILTIGENVTVLKNGTDSIGVNDFAIRLGSSLGDCNNAIVNVESGKFSWISGGNNANDVVNSTITISGDTEIVAYIQGGGTNQNVTTSTVNIEGGTIPALYVNGYGTAAMQTSEITISGGEIDTISDARPEIAATGKLTGELTVNIMGNMFDYIDSFNLDYMDGITGDKNLVISYTNNATTGIEFSDWDNVTLNNNSIVYLTNEYSSPVTSMTVESGCSLILTAESTGAQLPTYSGAGIVAFGTIPDEEVIFIDGISGIDDNDGFDSIHPIKTFSQGLNLLNGEGGIVVICGDVEIGPYLVTQLNDKITITSYYNGVDYGAKMNFGATNSKAVLIFQSEVEFNNITLNHVYTLCSEIWSSTILTIGENVTVLKNGTDSIGVNDFAIRLGLSSADCSSATVNVESGKFSWISGGNNANDVVSSTINISGDTKIVAYIQGGGTNQNVTTSTVNIEGGTIPALYVNGYGTAAMQTSEITISGGAVVKSIMDARTSSSSKLTGTSEIEINGNTALRSIYTFDLNSVSGISGTKYLDIKNIDGAICKFNFSTEDYVVITNNSDMFHKYEYSAPAINLTIDSGSVLRLAADTQIPTFSGNGDIVFTTYSEMGHDYTGEPYDESLYTSYTKSASSSQGMAVYDKYAFMFYHGGSCDVIDLETKQIVSNFNLASYTGSSTDAYANHANQAVFSNTFYNSSDTFPLLYVTIGNAAGSDSDGYYGRCAVERIMMQENADGSLTFSSTLMQTIIFNDNNYATGVDYKYTDTTVSDYESPCWGWPASFPDTENDTFYLFSARYRTNADYLEYYDVNAYIITCFDLPTINTVGETVILYPTDITDQFTTEFDILITQGGTFYNGKIYYTYGLGGSTYPDAIRVFDISERCIVAKIDLSDSIFASQEIESCSVYNETLLCNTWSGNIYQLEYIESIWYTETDEVTNETIQYTECCICGTRLQEIVLPE